MVCPTRMFACGSVAKQEQYRSDAGEKDVVFERPYTSCYLFPAEAGFYWPLVWTESDG